MALKACIVPWSKGCMIDVQLGGQNLRSTFVKAIVGSSTCEPKRQRKRLNESMHELNQQINTGSVDGKNNFSFIPFHTQIELHKDRCKQAP